MARNVFVKEYVNDTSKDLDNYCNKYYCQWHKMFANKDKQGRLMTAAVFFSSVEQTLKKHDLYDDKVWKEYGR